MLPPLKAGRLHGDAYHCHFSLPREQRQKTIIYCKRRYVLSVTKMSENETWNMAGPCLAADWLNINWTPQMDASFIRDGSFTAACGLFETTWRWIEVIHRPKKRWLESMFL